MSTETHDNETINQDQNETHENDNGSTDVSGLTEQQLRDELSKVRREAASRRIELKEFKAKADKWEEYEQSQKSEMEKLQDELAKRDQELSSFKLGQLRASIAKDVGLDAEDAELLSGSDEATLRSQAEKLKSRLGTKQEEKRTPADLLAGKRGQPIGGNSTGSSFDDMIRASARRL